MLIGVDEVTRDRRLGKQMFGGAAIDGQLLLMFCASSTGLELEDMNRRREACVALTGSHETINRATDTAFIRSQRERHFA